MKKQALIILILLSFWSCERQTDWLLDDERLNLIVVDGIITSEQKVHTISIMRPVKELNEKPQPVSGATVKINYGTTVYPLIEDITNPGQYKTDSTFYAVAGRKYKLTINYGNKEYYANVNTPAAETFTPLIYAKTQQQNMYHIVWVAGIYNPIKYAMWEILLDWSDAPGYENEVPENCKTRLLYYTLPTLDVGEIFGPQIEKINFPSGTKITEKRYSITNEYAYYLRAMLSETSWQGGLFDVAHSNVPTNLSDGAIGFFASCPVVSVETVVN